MFSGIAAAGRMVEGDDAAGTCPPVAPAGDEVVGTKRRERVRGQ